MFPSVFPAVYLCLTQQCFTHIKVKGWNNQIALTVQSQPALNVRAFLASMRVFACFWMFFWMLWGFVFFSKKASVTEDDHMSYPLIADDCKPQNLPSILQPQVYKSGLLRVMWESKFGSGIEIQTKNVSPASRKPRQQVTWHCTAFIFVGRWHGARLMSSRCMELLLLTFTDFNVTQYLLHTCIIVSFGLRTKICSTQNQPPRQPPLFTNVHQKHKLRKLENFTQVKRLPPFE